MLAECSRFSARHPPPAPRPRDRGVQGAPALSTDSGDKVAFLGTTLLDPEQYPAAELIALYRERWEIELAFDEIKNHLGPGGPIRSRTPEGVRQELWAYLAVHHAIRRFAHTAALAGPAVESDRVSYLKCVRVIRRSVPSQLGATTAGLARSLTEAGQEARSRLLPIRRKRTSPRAIKKPDRWPVLRTRAKRGAVEPGRWALNQTKKAKSNRRAGRPVLKPPPRPRPRHRPEMVAVQKLATRRTPLPHSAQGDRAPAYLMRSSQ
ncbi:transposase [Streptomyces prasinus]